jgi:hypothetical protein
VLNNEPRAFACLDVVILGSAPILIGALSVLLRVRSLLAAMTAGSLSKVSLGLTGADSGNLPLFL